MGKLIWADWGSGEVGLDLQPILKEVAKEAKWLPLDFVRGITIPQFCAVFMQTAEVNQSGLNAAYDAIDAQRAAKGLPPIDRGGSFTPIGNDPAALRAWLKERSK